MKKALLAIAVLFMAAGCDELEGTFTALQNIEVYKNGSVDEVIPAGRYEAEIENESKKNRLEIKLENENGDDYKIKYTYPEGYTFPETGSFELSKDKSNQVYDMAGMNRKTVEVSEDKVGYESCRTQGYQECFYDQWGRPHCRWVYRWGERRIEYRDVTTTQTTDVELIDNGVVAATLFADRTSVRRDYTYQGFCR